MKNIRVLENNYNKEETEEEQSNKPIKTKCDQCGSVLEITEDDTYIGAYGAAYLICPCCENESMVDELDGITLTKDNIEYPTHFVHTAKGLRHVKEVFPEEIQKEIKRGVDYLRKNNEDGCGRWYTSFGNLFLIIFRYPGDEEYFVLVTQDFYETHIPFEEIDYE